MNQKEIETYSHKIKRQAELILKQTKLLDILSHFGTPHVIGSYALDLMWNPDLDIVVTSKDIRKSSVEALKTIVEKRICQKLEYGDFVKFKRPKRPAGYIIVLKIVQNNIPWEIEIWFLPNAKKEKQYVKYITNALSPEIKKRILKFKYLIHKNNISKKQISSMDVYEAVIDKKITSFKNLL